MSSFSLLRLNAPNLRTRVYQGHLFKGFLARMATTATQGPQLSLTPAEDLFRRSLLECRNHMQDVHGMKDLELRWTGGWVRDKLLNTQSHDIDVALSTMTGEQFGKALQTYMKDHGERYTAEAQKQGISADLKDLHKIKANPEKSKNLETITTRMFGLEVDFVNLRKEVYTADSRNPQMEFGTPQEDALRRDACVNALFYNLDTQQVEDFTGRGLDDMEAKLIRTPLEPMQTFLDDPLRVLRLIRFAARLGYTIHGDALKAMADPHIHEALRKKISRERVGVEIGKIMVGPDPYRGLSMVYELGLYTTVFTDPHAQPERVDTDSLATTLDFVRRFSIPGLPLDLGFQDDLTTTWTVLMYVPFRHDETTAVHAAREGIKATNAIIKTVSDSVKNWPRIRQMCAAITVGAASRSDIGMTLRAMGKSGGFQILYAYFCDIVESKDEKYTIQQYLALRRYVREQGLENAAEMKQVLNGNEVKDALEVAKAGPWLKGAIEKVVAWQFANPQGTREDAIAWIKAHKEELQTG